jgi:hypothetical protein
VPKSGVPQLSLNHEIKVDLEVQLISEHVDVAIRRLIGPTRKTTVQNCRSLP